MDIIRPEEIFKDVNENHVAVFFKEFNRIMSDPEKQVACRERGVPGILWKFTCQGNHSMGTELKIRQGLIAAGWTVFSVEHSIFIDEWFAFYKVSLP